MIDLKPGVRPRSAAITWLPTGATWLVGDSLMASGNPGFEGGAFWAAAARGNMAESSREAPRERQPTKARVLVRISLFKHISARAGPGEYPATLAKQAL